MRVNLLPGKPVAPGIFLYKEKRTVVYFLAEVFFAFFLAAEVALAPGFAFFFAAAAFVFGFTLGFGMALGLQSREREVASRPQESQ